MTTVLIESWLYDSDVISGLSPRAQVRFLKSVFYSSQHLTDGLIPNAFVRHGRITEELVAGGAWLAGLDGWMLAGKMPPRVSRQGVPPRWLYFSLGAPRPMVAIQSRAYTDWVLSRPAPRSVPPVMRHAVISRDGLTCRICSQPISDAADVHIDHIVPWSLGGKTALENLRVTHGFCNVRRGNRLDAD